MAKSLTKMNKKQSKSPVSQQLDNSEAKPDQQIYNLNFAEQRPNEQTNHQNDYSKLVQHHHQQIPMNYPNNVCFSNESINPASNQFKLWQDYLANLQKNESFKTLITHMNDLMAQRMYGHLNEQQLQQQSLSSSSSSSSCSFSKFDLKRTDASEHQLDQNTSDSDLKQTDDCDLEYLHKLDSIESENDVNNVEAISDDEDNNDDDDDNDDDDSNTSYSDNTNKKSNESSTTPEFNSASILFKSSPTSSTSSISSSFLSLSANNKNNRDIHLKQESTSSTSSEPKVYLKHSIESILGLEISKRKSDTLNISDNKRHKF